MNAIQWLLYVFGFMFLGAAMEQWLGTGAALAVIAGAFLIACGIERFSTKH